MEYQSARKRRSTTGTLHARRLPTLIAPGVEAEALLRSTLDALSAHIAVLDETGTIIAVNRAWRTFAHASGYADENHGVGINYLAVCEGAAPLSKEAARTAQALREIMAGACSEFRMEYPCRSPQGPRWFQIRVTRPDQAQICRIVIAHEDITEVKRTQQELARLSGRLMHLQDEERRAIARELHDTTAQNLLAITLNASRLHGQLCDAGEPVHRILKETLELAEQSLQEVRTLSYLLHPPLLDDVGLTAALSWLARGFSERSGIRVDISIENSGEPLPRPIATALYRVAQEALSNVHRHSGSKQARLALSRKDDIVRLDIVDGGIGFKALPHANGDDAQLIGVGISGMRLRLEQLGGQLEIHSSPLGTRVSASFTIGSCYADGCPPNDLSKMPSSEL
ncbi:PAS domain-containing sensor histidine kinase [Microvirga sp. VF16]|uniref:sensor histidine kinase n=1 Tax=Microvirga sp. VF16 TaxID=2807101 RepID=UPI00193D7259|nr:PAS domain-containing sensor histidine kinase [Microvirga sp. VF16]QRM34078.1 PAS domain-containing protein [Microvirga sp. VF16]